jgi:20S proteasome alpha/beta subunit
MTVCIAAFTKPGSKGGQIVATADRLISNNDYVQGSEDTLKVRKIANSWALMFAGRVNFFRHFVVEAVKFSKMNEEEKKLELDVIQEHIAKTYRAEFERQFTAQHISPLGYSSVSDFRENGLAQLGADSFNFYLDRLREFDLGIQLLCFGFDPSGEPHIFTVANPGVITNHNLLRYAVIGSGDLMALAALRRKKLPYNNEALVYRLLDAKFSAETASGVGTSTSLLTMGPDGKSRSMGYDAIDKIKAIWTAKLKEPEPADALDIIIPYTDPLSPRGPQDQS